jgi:hypothetical protein
LAAWHGQIRDEHIARNGLQHLHQFG